MLMQVDRAKVLSNTIKQKRKQKAGKWEVPLPKVSHWLDALLLGEIHNAYCLGIRMISGLAASCLGKEAGIPRCTCTKEIC